MSVAQATQWQPLGNGIDYTSISLPNTHIKGQLHAFRLNLANNRLSLAMAQDHNSYSASVKRLGRLTGAVIAINGGFFSPQWRPLGLRIQDGNIRSPLKTNTSWWGVFYIQNNRANIVPPKSFRYNKRIQFAVQAGPRLLINGRIPSLKAGYDERSALCITRSGNVIIAATEDAPISTTQLAQQLKMSQQQGGLGCYNALNLDGGTSTQLYADIGKFKLYIPSLITVTDAVIVFPNKKTAAVQ